MQMWTWYEWLFWALAAAILFWFVTEALDWSLDRLKDRRDRAALDRLNREAPVEPNPISQAAESFRALGEALGKPYPKRNRENNDV